MVYTRLFVSQSLTQQPKASLDLLILEVSRSQTKIPQSVGLLWTRDRPVAEIST
jgi:hypothetical protein